MEGAGAVAWGEGEEACGICGGDVEVLHEVGSWRLEVGSDLRFTIYNLRFMG